MSLAVEALDHEAVDVLITTGSASAVAALHPVPANVHVEAYVPQAYVLPRCSAVICHAGAGTTLAALARSVPLLLLPQGADQYRIADFVARSGAALRLAPPEVTPARVRQHVLGLLAEDHYRRAAARIAREIAAMPDASSAAVRVANVTRRK